MSDIEETRAEKIVWDEFFRSAVQGLLAQGWLRLDPDREKLIARDGARIADSMILERRNRKR